MASKPYNGHRNWNHWNVALWIGNDHWIYTVACECLTEARGNKRAAALAFIQTMRDGYDVDRTPDGAKYSISAVLAALRGLHS